MYFPPGRGTLKGVGKPGEIVWSRVFVEGGTLHAEFGREALVELPVEEIARRWNCTTSQWPMVNAVFHDITRNGFMARHRGNHVNIAYATDSSSANRALAVKAAMLHEMGVKVYLCGRVNLQEGKHDGE